MVCRDSVNVYKKVKSVKSLSSQNLPKCPLITFLPLYAYLAEMQFFAKTDYHLIHELDTEWTELPADGSEAVERTGLILENVVAAVFHYVEVVWTYVADGGLFQYLQHAGWRYRRVGCCPVIVAPDGVCL